MWSTRSASTFSCCRYDIGRNSPGLVLRPWYIMPPFHLMLCPRLPRGPSFIISSSDRYLILANAGLILSHWSAVIYHSILTAVLKLKTLSTTTTFRFSRSPSSLALATAPSKPIVSINVYDGRAQRNRHVQFSNISQREDFPTRR